MYIYDLFEQIEYLQFSRYEYDFQL